jgi:hypothetical protein
MVTAMRPSGIAHPANYREDTATRLSSVSVVEFWRAKCPNSRRQSAALTIPGSCLILRDTAEADRVRRIATQWASPGGKTPAMLRNEATKYERKLSSRSRRNPGVQFDHHSEFFVYARTHSPLSTMTQKEKNVTKNASGTFDVKAIPQAPEANVGDPTIGRLALDKQFHGDLEGVSKGQMLGVSTEVQGSAGYVAMERVNGTLHGRKGTFALQHTGTMTQGVPALNVSVVPDSGTGDLLGIAGRMTINIVDGKHLYELEYTLTESK